MQITLNFNFPLNISLTPGDQVWYTDPLASGGYSTSSISTGVPTMNNPQLLGVVVSVSGVNSNQISEVVVTNSVLLTPPVLTANQTYFMFRKNRKVNLASLTGYYAEARLINNSKEKAELFAVSSEVVQSSK
jgi:hypothetical protein|tara:strand:+ start:6902 stop:7297 length:396 start_codon:yes stop_codon:yes gene_type:complete